MNCSCQRLLLFISLLFTTTMARVDSKSASKGRIAPQFNSDRLLKAMGVPACVRTCIDPFLHQVEKLWDLRNIVDNVRPLCSSRPVAVRCLANSPGCDPYQLFKVSSAMVEKMCVHRAALFEKVRPCLKVHGDRVAHTCDERCSGRAELTAFLNKPAIIRAANMGGNILAVNDHLGGLCRALNCDLGCITTELNKVCPLSGWLTLDILLQPLESVADLLLNATPAIKDFIAKKMDKRCRFLLNKSELMKLRKGQFSSGVL